MKNSRIVKHSLEPVAAYPVAPHRYLWTAPVPDHIPTKWRDVIAAAPYKVGDVVLTVYGDGYRRAYVERVSCDKDRFDDWRECYHVLPETKAGTWSKLYHVTHPGLIQRAYIRAGQAPDCPPENELFRSIL